MPNCNCSNLLMGSKPPRPKMKWTYKSDKGEIPLNGDEVEAIINNEVFDKLSMPESILATSKKERYETLKKDVHLALNRFSENFNDNMTIEVINDWMLNSKKTNQEVLDIIDKLADLFDYMKKIRDRFEIGSTDYYKYDYKLDGIRQAINKVEEEI